MKGIIMGNKDNVILNNMDEQVGYYADLRASLVDSAKLYMDEDDIENAKDALELIEELDEKYKDYGGLIVLGSCNGMGYSYWKYRDDWEVAQWVAENIAPEDDDAMPKIYSDYERQKDFMAQVKEYMKES